MKKLTRKQEEMLEEIGPEGLAEDLATLLFWEYHFPDFLVTDLVAVLLDALKKQRKSRIEEDFV